MSRVSSFHIEVEEETDYSTRFFYNNQSTGLPVDLTDFRAEMQVRKKYYGDSEVIVPLLFTSEDGGGIVLGGTAGTIDLYIVYEDTRSLNWDQGLYTLILINPSGGRTPFVKGFFTVNSNTTRLASTGLPNIVSGTPDHPNNLGIGGEDGS